MLLQGDTCTVEIFVYDGQERQSQKLLRYNSRVKKQLLAIEHVFIDIGVIHPLVPFCNRHFIFM